MKVKITVPTSLKDIKLSQYQKLLRTTKDIEDADWTNRQMVAILCGIPGDSVKNIYKKDYDEILKSIEAVLSQAPKLKPIIEHNGREYGFIPDLNEITVGEQGDIDTLISDYQKMDRVMAILYRPITSRRKDRYTIGPYTGKEDPLDLTMDIVTGATGFFLSLLNDLLTCTQNFIEREAERPQTRRLLEENGVGTKIFTDSLRETFSTLRGHLNLSYTRP